MKKIRLISWITFAFGGLGFVVYTSILDRRVDMSLLNESYHERIREIKYKQSNRGKPSIKVDENWVDFSWWYPDLFDSMQLNDSIVKQEGKHEIILYRENEVGDLEKKVFDHTLGL